MLDKYSGNYKPCNYSFGLFDALGGVISSMFNYGSTTQTNALNRRIADENLGFQAQRANIEDKRYEDETAYNRAFAEDQRDYERQLQQQIFEREDTALERQASQLSNLGINPLSQQLNGLGAGAAVSPGSAPSASAQSAMPLNNSFKAEAPKVDLNFGGLLDEINEIDNLNTRGIQRDLLTQQKNAQILANQEKEIENLIKMDKYDISVDSDGNLILNRKFEHKEQDTANLEYRNRSSEVEREERENEHQKTYGTHNNSSTRSNDISDVARQADRAMSTVSDLGKNASEASKKAGDLLLESAKKKMSSAKQAVTKKKNSVVEWFKKHSTSADNLQNIYGF